MHVAFHTSAGLRVTIDMTSLTSNATKVSLRTCGMTDEQHKRIVGPSTANIFWENTAIIELDQLCDSVPRQQRQEAHLDTGVPRPPGDDDDLAEDDDWNEVMTNAASSHGEETWLR